MYTSLCERWHYPGIRKVTRNILWRFWCDRWRHATDLSPFGLIHGRWDFRGFPFLEGERIRNISFNNIDFTSAQFRRADLIRCSFQNVLLSNASLDEVTDFDNQFENCEFFGTRILHSSIGHEGSRYNQCRFERCIFTRTSMIRPEFNDCQFVSCDLDDIDFSASSFVRCKFTGKIIGCMFRNGFFTKDMNHDFGVPRVNEMAQVDFSEAELHMVGFLCDISMAILPMDGKHFRFDRIRERIPIARNLLADWPDNALKEIEILFSIFMSMKMDWVILNVNDLIDEYHLTQYQADELIRILHKSL